MVWVTGNLTDSVVKYGESIDKLMSTSGDATIFIDGGPEKRSMWIHKVVLQDLKSDQRYCKLHC